MVGNFHAWDKINQATPGTPEVVVIFEYPLDKVSAIIFALDESLWLCWFQVLNINLFAEMIGNKRFLSRKEFWSAQKISNPEGVVCFSMPIFLFVWSLASQSLSSSTLLTLTSSLSSSSSSSMSTSARFSLRAAFLQLCWLDPSSSKARPVTPRSGKRHRLPANEKFRAVTEVATSQDPIFIFFAERRIKKKNSKCLAASIEEVWSQSSINLLTIRASF